MPSSVSIDSKTYPIQTIKEWLGATVPWNVKGPLEDLVAAETVGGIFDFSTWSTISIQGKDTKDFLHRMTTVDFKKFHQDAAASGAFLTGKGTIVSLGTFIEENSQIHFIITPNQSEIAAKHIEQFHFAEELTVKDISNEWATLAWWNPRADLLEDFHLDRNLEPMRVEWRRWKSLNMYLWRDLRMKDLFWVHLSRKQASPFLFELERLGVPLLGQGIYEYFRIQNGVPQVGVEITEKEIILEANFDEAVARNKGCYPGQEVVERIFTYGSVNRKLFPVKVDIGKNAQVQLPLAVAEGASLVSFAEDPRRPKTGWGLCYLKKGLWDSNQVFRLDSIKITFEIGKHA